MTLRGFSAWLAELPVNQIFNELDASEFQQSCPFFPPPIDRQAHLPWTRERLAVFDRGFVIQMVRAHGCDPLDHVQRVTVEVPGPIEPAQVVESGRIDDE